MRAGFDPKAVEAVYQADELAARRRFHETAGATIFGEKRLLSKPETRQPYLNALIDFTAFYITTLNTPSYTDFHQAAILTVISHTSTLMSEHKGTPRLYGMFSDLNHRATLFEHQADVALRHGTTPPTFDIEKSEILSLKS